MGGVWRKIPFTYAVMWIGNLALAGLPFFAGYYSKDMILEAAFASGSGVGRFAFALGIAAALLTAFYSWRLLFMTFHGTPRMDKEVYDHAHESPVVMLVPLAVLTLGALFAGVGFHEYFIGHDRAEFWGKALLTLHGNDAIEAAHHHTPGWVAIAPLVVGLIGIAMAYIGYVMMPRLPGRIASIFSGIHKFLYNKWYFDELYDALFTRPAKALGYGLWKSGDGAVIDGVGPDGVAAATRDIAARTSRLQSGYVYHYAFAMLADPVVRDLPAARGRRADPAVLPGQHPGRAAERAVHLAVDDPRHLRPDPADLGQLRSAQSRLPDGREGGLDPRVRHQLPHGRRRHLGAVRRPGGLPDAAVHPGELGVGAGPPQGIHDRLPRAGNPDDRDVLRAGLRSVLHVLRRRPDPDVPDHRHLGRPAPRLRRLQVLPLHAARLGPDAAGDPGHVLRGRHHRHPDHHRHPVPAQHAALAVAGLLRLLRGEGADVAGPHLAAGCPRRGADRRVGDPGRRAAEDGRLRLPALQHSDPAGGDRVFRAADLHPVGRRRDLHLAGRSRPGGHEEADRLLVGRPHGLRHHRHVRAEPAGHRRLGVPDAVARRRLWCAVPVRRRRL
ncbi:hypothetical protein Lal_00005330 [Lupinus albus]|nr:hypothetical protein Lal_00005330 [Lupinus albus]